MSSKQVPEKPQLPIRIQMMRLKKWVDDHRELFERYRGGVLNGFGQYKFLKPDTTISPTADQREYNDLVGSVRVLRNSLAVFHRDGCSVAADALWSALLYKDRWERPLKLPFEEDLQTEMEPMVLLMFDPERIFPIMRWYSESSSNIWEFEALWEDKGQNTPRDDTREIALLLPSLKKHWEKNRFSQVLYAEVFKAIAEDVFTPFGDAFNACVKEGMVAAMYTVSQHRRSPGGRYTSFHQAYNEVAFAYLLRGVHQRDVLKRIPRQLQSMVATWQFEVYGKTWFGVPRHQITLIPEEELSSWQGICQSSLSKGVAAGHMAVYNPHDAFQSLPDGNKRDASSTLFLHYC